MTSDRDLAYREAVNTFLNKAEGYAKRQHAKTGEPEGRLFQKKMDELTQGHGLRTVRPDKWKNFNPTRISKRCPKCNTRVFR